MESLESPTAAAAIGIALIFVLAGFVKGAIGLGLPTVAMGLLGLLMPPAQAASLLIVPSFVTNVWQLLSGPRAAGRQAHSSRASSVFAPAACAAAVCEPAGCEPASSEPGSQPLSSPARHARERDLLRRFAWMMIGVCAGTWMMQALLAPIAQSIDAQSIASQSTAAQSTVAQSIAVQSIHAQTIAAPAFAVQSYATGALGLALAAYALVGLLARPWSVPPARERWLSPLVGVATGLVTGATGVFVMPAVPYLQALDLDKEALMQALGLSFTVSTLALAIGLAGDGTFDLAAARASVLALAPALTGMALGAFVRRRVSPARFRLAFLVALLALGLHLCWRAA